MKKLGDFKDTDILLINGQEVLVKYLKYFLEYKGVKNPNEFVLGDDVKLSNGD